jgi:hypothetical protein
VLFILPEALQDTNINHPAFVGKNLLILNQPNGDFQKKEKILSVLLTINLTPLILLVSRRWEPDTTPESSLQHVPAANVVPPPTLSATQPPVSQPPSPASVPDMKGSFFAGGYGPSPDMDTDTKKQFIALHMKHLQQQWDNA